MHSHPRVLLSTVYRDGPLYDYWGSNTPRTVFRLSGKRVVSMGLRFIKQNVPGIEILEAPTRAAMDRMLKQGWDVLGISFYLDETDRALEMIDAARRAGVREIWGGNYGVLTPGVAPNFDRAFLGYAEGQIAGALGQKHEVLLHPPMVVPFGVPLFKILRFGLLFTTRGCSFGCNFCQTPSFAPTPSAIPLESIDRVLDCYASHRVEDILIPDENFGILPRQAEAVAERFARRRMLWTVMTRVDFLLKHFNQWRRQGLAGVMLGIERVDQEGLNALGKRTTVDRLYEAIELCRQHGIVMVGYFIIGLETDTEESIRADILQLRTLGFDLVQVCILTPLPQTPLWQTIDQSYGIDNRDYCRFDGKHLVWRHPALDKGRMEGLLQWSFKTLYPRTTFARSVLKHARAHARRIGRARAAARLAADVAKLNLRPFRQLGFLTRPDKSNDE